MDKLAVMSNGVSENGPTKTKTNGFIGDGSHPVAAGNQSQEIQNSSCTTSLDQLPANVQRLCRASVEIRQKAYAPYSKFLVGAALQTDTGDVITGCNVENASYGLSICAERSACVKAVSEGSTEFTAIAIAADLQTDEFCGPCGACRQFLAEFHPYIPIYLVRVKDNVVQRTTLKDLLPGCFSPRKIYLPFIN